MKEDPVDPRMEKLVASLYNELSEDEERALRLEIDADPELRAAWDELRATRTLFQSLEVEEACPSFVVVDRADSSRAGSRKGFGARLMEFQAWGGWAVAAAAVLFLLFGMGGFRVEKLENGFAFRFGSDKGASDAPRRNDSAPRDVPGRFAEQAPGSNAGVEAPRQVAGSVPGAERSQRQAGSVSGAEGSREVAGLAPGAAATDRRGAETVSLNPGDAYMTQAEFDTRSSEVLKMVVALLNDYRTRRDQELSTMMQAVYGQLNEQQTSDYRELRGRIEAVGLGLRAEQTRTNSFIEDLLGHTGADSGAVGTPRTEDGN